MWIRQRLKKGQRFSGIVRFATPVFNKDGFAGIITLALDYSHLAEFTDHLVPTQAEKVFETNASSGNYAYMVDNRGFVISHPSDFHIVDSIVTEQSFQLFRLRTRQNCQRKAQKR